jgi:hypothetical protein
MRGERVGRRSGIEIRMRWQAGEFVRQVTARNRLPLDYSVDSLRVVDFIVDGVRKGEPERARARQVLYGLGIYVGEVFVRRAGGVWVEFDAQQRELFGQVVKRFDAGASESVRMLYLQVHGREARPIGCGRRTA